MKLHCKFVDVTIDKLYEWLAPRLPKKLVLQCLYRAIHNSAYGRMIQVPKRKYGKRIVLLSNYDLEDVLFDWREVCNGEAREMR